MKRFVLSLCMLIMVLIMVSCGDNAGVASEANNSTNKINNDVAEQVDEEAYDNDEIMSDIRLDEVFIKDYVIEDFELEIPPVEWDEYEGIEDVGWDGEASIQMASLYHGVYYSQKNIFRRGKSVHKDLWYYNIETALAGLGLSYDKYANASGEVEESLDRYVNWISDALNDDIPVLSGMKKYPDCHTSSSLDHLVLFTGEKDDTFTYNGNAPGYSVITENKSNLKEPLDGYRIYNKFGMFFGIRIEGVEGVEEPFPRLLVDHYDDKIVDIAVSSATTNVGETYELIRYSFESSWEKQKNLAATTVAVITVTDNNVWFVDRGLDKHINYYYEFKEVK